ncbi:MAG: hypothetical protein GXO65_02190 [Euryarchaeota archaeon]|nr:hypothetical protein [Euryarchaeota archaeon]
MKVEAEGILTREKGQIAIKDEEGKKRLVSNLFNGFAGKRIKITIEEVEEETGEGAEAEEEEAEKES